MRFRSAVGYGRVSTPDQKKYGDSLGTQKENIENFCLTNNIVLLKSFFDDYSGANFERPEFQSMLNFLKSNKGEVDLLLVDRQDRFSRNTEHALVMTSKLKSLGVEVNFVSEWIENVDSEEGKLISNIKYTLAEIGRDKIKKVTTMGTRRALKKGRYTKTPPRGFTRGKNSDKKTILVHNKDAQLIKELFKDYSLDIYSQKELIKKYKFKGLELSKSGLSRMLSNVLYAGLIDLNRHKIEPYTIIEGKHEPIVSKELFDKVQIIKNSRKNKLKNTKRVNENFPLTGFLECADCGEKLRGSNTNNGNNKKTKRFYNYYECKSEYKCKQRYRAELIHDELIKQLAKIKPDKTVMNMFSDILIEEYQTYNIERIKVLENIEKNIGKLNELRFSLTEKFVANLIDEDYYLQLKKQYSSEKIKFEAKKQELGNYQEDLNKVIVFGLDMLTNLDTLYQNSDSIIKKKILGSILDKRLIFSDNIFRTLIFNEAISLITSVNKGSIRAKIKKGDDLDIISHSVHLMDLFSNQLLKLFQTFTEV
jgi:DNA invertase Pin-like site-specific DNA recombinase